MISIIITTFNSRNTIKETLSSIKGQSFTNYEVIIVDDGSSDDTVECIKSLSLDFVKIFERPHFGRASSLNFGLGICKFELVAICDSDDLWHSDKLQIQVDFFMKNQNVDLVFSSTKLFQSSDVDLNSKKVVLHGSEPITLRRILLSNIITHSSVLYKKDMGVYNEGLSSQIDLDFWLRSLRSGKLFTRLRSDPIVFHRIHQDQSFEGSGLNYRWNAIKLVNNYAYKWGYFDMVILNTLKVFYYLFSRYLRTFGKVKGFYTVLLIWSYVCVM